MIDDYLQTLSGETKTLITHMYKVLRPILPAECTEGLSYGMPAITYKGKGVVAIMARKQFVSIYPFSGRVVSELQAELQAFEYTSGSIHCTPEHPVPDALLCQIVTSRLAALERS